MDPLFADIILAHETLFFSEKSFMPPAAGAPLLNKERPLQDLMGCIGIHAVFYKQQFYKQRQAEVSEKSSKY